MLSKEIKKKWQIRNAPNGRYNLGSLGTNLTEEQVIATINNFCPHGSETAISMALIELGGRVLLPADDPGRLRPLDEWLADAEPAIRIMKVGLSLLDDP